MRAPFAVLLLSAGCGAGALGNFTDGLTLNRCDETHAVCARTAGCVLGEGGYLEGRFPGSRQMIVPTPADAVIHVDVFFVDQTAAGTDTRIRWHEPGCFDTYTWRSEGRDLFLLAGRGRRLTQSQQVREPGDHLVEIDSDAIAEYLLRVRIDAPGE
jgi:hypothetical protein